MGLRGIQVGIIGLALVWVAVACDGDSGSKDSTAQDDVADSSAPLDAALDQSEPDAVSDAADSGDTAGFEVGDWEAVEPGGETKCADGSAYRFFVRPGDPKKAVVFMQGGGACWSLLTCGMGAAMSSLNVPSMEEFLAGQEQNAIAGILDVDNPENPFPDWTIVYIPYCTSDLHWGQGDHEYSSKVKVYHHGFFNAQAAIEWMYDYVKDPELLVLTGASAGGYGMLIHSAWVSQHYPLATVRVVVDAAAGVVAGDFTAQSMAVWNATESMPTFIPEVAEKDLMTVTFLELFGAIGRYFPENRYSLYSTAWDDMQTFFFKVMGGNPEEWPAKLQETVTALKSNVPQFSSFITSGTLHTILNLEVFYQREEAGVRLVDWLSQFVFGETLPEDRNCTGEQCSFDPLCDVCPQDGTGPSYCGLCLAMSNL